MNDSSKMREEWQMYYKLKMDKLTYPIIRYLHNFSSSCVLWVVPNPKLFNELHDMGLPSGDPVGSHVQSIILTLWVLYLNGEGATPNPCVGF
jgi:hypothetical protein